MTGLHDTSHRADNNIGFIRLLLASLVIVSHSQFIFYSQGVEEPLKAWFNRNIAFGTLAVDGFFLLSGWLITQSWMRSRSWQEYLLKRVLRIYPAFVVAFLVTMLLSGVRGSIWDILLLQPPPNLPDGTSSNASLWTIAYEFRCYLLVMLLGSFGVLTNRRVILHLALGCFAIFLIANRAPIAWRIESWAAPDWMLALIGHPWANLRLLPIFMFGVTAKLYEDELLPILRNSTLIIWLWALPFLVFDFRPLAEASAIAFWGPALLWLAFHAHLGIFQRINDRWDISYGTYLFASPIQHSLGAAFPALSWPIYLAAALVLSWSAGWLSWMAVERPTASLKHRFPQGDWRQG